jgi:hypothetical protein
MLRRRIASRVGCERASERIYESHFQLANCQLASLIFCFEHEARKARSKNQAHKTCWHDAPWRPQKAHFEKALEMCVCTWYGDVQGKSQGLLLFPVSVCDENEFQRSESMMNDMNGVLAHRCSILLPSPNA